MAADDEFADALRQAVAELTARYHRIELPETEADPVRRVLAAIGAAVLDTLPDDIGADVLRFLGEAACDDGR